MRYRRLLEHVKAQNWFAVLLDFLIVVLGILIAYQITESSNERKEQQELDRALSNVAQEILETISASQQHIKFAEHVVNGLEFVLDAMNTQKPLSEDELQKVTMALMKQPFPPPTNFRVTTLLELQNSGRLKDVEPDILRNDLKIWLANVDNNTLFRDAYFRGVSLPDIPVELVDWEYTQLEGTTAPIPVIVNINLDAAKHSKAFRSRLMTIISLYQRKMRTEKNFVFAGNELLAKLEAEGYTASNSRYLEQQEELKRSQDKSD